MTEKPPLLLGSEVTPEHENVVCRTQSGDIVYAHPGERLTVTALGCGLAICARHDGQLLSIQTADLNLWTA